MNGKLIYLATFLLIVTSSFAQRTAEETLQKLFDYSRHGEYAKASELIAYAGEDKNRYLKTSLNYLVEAERKRTERICKRISKYLKISTSHTVQAKNLSPNSHGKSVTLTVQFKSGTQVINVNFVFIKTSKEFLLKEIN